MKKLYGGIEFGGTKNVCIVGDDTGKIYETKTIPTTTPEETMPQIIKFFKEIQSQKKLYGIGIASFGPIDPNITSPKYGYITTTPKIPWSNYNLVGALKEEFNLPMGFDTDVNGSALGEYHWGAGKGLDTFIYWTVGTGIGAGGIISGKPIHGLLHPEMGHMFIPHNLKEDPFEGICPYHKNCLEGLASGPSMSKRWGIKIATDLEDNHIGWDIEAKYLAYAMMNCILTLSPQRIILGGGIMHKEILFPKIRKYTLELLNNYIKHDTILKDIDNYIVPPKLGKDAGIWGAIVLAEEAEKRMK